MTQSMEAAVVGSCYTNIILNLILGIIATFELKMLDQ